MRTFFPYLLYPSVSNAELIKRLLATKMALVVVEFAFCV